MTLSAGADSRAVFSLLLTVFDASRIVAITEGDTDSLDSKLSKHIAKRYGTRSYLIEDVSHHPDFKPFLTLCDLKIFPGNGDLTVKDATLKSVPVLESNPGIVCHGDGGEMYRQLF